MDGFNFNYDSYQTPAASFLGSQAVDYNAGIYGHTSNNYTGPSLNEQLGIYGYSNGDKKGQYGTSLFNSAVNLGLGLLNYSSGVEANKQNQKIRSVLGSLIL